MNADYLEITSAAFAVLAAILWISSSLIRMPRDYTVQVISTHVYDDDNMIGNSVISQGYGTSRELEDLGGALVRQSRLNAGAAICAAISAVCHAAIFALHF